MTDHAPVQSSVPASHAVIVVSTSRAADAGYRTLADLSDIADNLGVDYRIVGGHMVTLLVAAHGVSNSVPMRETLDADFRRSAGGDRRSTPVGGSDHA